MYSALAGRDLLSIADLSRDDITAVLDEAVELKRDGAARRPLESKSVGMILQRPSNRTRVSFEVAIQQLGGHAIPIFSEEIQLGQRESVGDIARILDGYLDGIVARLYNQADLEGMADHAEAPVINAMTDAEHPCQILADLLTIREHVGDRARVTYIGDGNNVCNSWILAAAITGLDLRLVVPEGYDPNPEVGASMGQEHEHEGRRRDFGEYQVNAELLKLAPSSARVMHCLPAHRGEEITDEVIDGPQSIVFEQAENRLHAQKALLALIYTPLVG